MAVHIVLLGILILAALASFVFSLMSGNKIFLVGAFLILAVSGLIIQGSGGLLIEQRPVSFANETIVYEDVTYDLTDPSVLGVSYLMIFMGGVLSAWSSWYFLFQKDPRSSFDF